MERPKDFNAMVAEAALRVIHEDYHYYRHLKGESPGKIFVSYPLRNLLIAYNKIMVRNWTNGPQDLLFGVPVSPFRPDGPDDLEYYFAEPGRKLDWTKEEPKHA